MSNCWRATDWYTIESCIAACRGVELCSAFELRAVELHAIPFRAVERCVVNTDKSRVGSVELPTDERIMVGACLVVALDVVQLHTVA